MRSILAMVLIVCLPMSAGANWELIAEDSFDGGPALTWSMEVRGDGAATFADGVMVLRNTSGWTIDPRFFGTLAVLEQALPDEYRVTYRIRNKVICGWFYTGILQDPFGDLSGTRGYVGVTEYCGPQMFLSEVPSVDGWTGNRLVEWHDSHLGLEPGRWRNVELTRKGGELTFYVEDETNLIATEPSELPSGLLNFYAHDGYIDVEIDDLKIYTWQSPVTSPVPVTLGTSWDNISLQQILDQEYGPGAINVETDYEGYRASDGDPAWWQDVGVNSILVREIASNSRSNRFGWHADDLAGPQVIDGIDDGVIFDGPVVAGSEVLIEFPSNIRFGFYLNPNGAGGTCNSPEPELFFANRQYNDLGPDGSGAIHAPFDGDVQCLIYNITHLRGGVPTYVLAWEDLDSGSEVTEAFWECGTDNDYNDLVVEISAFSPVKVEAGSWGEIKARYEE